MLNNNNYFTTDYYKWTESVMKYQPHSRITNKKATVRGREVGRFEPCISSGYVELRCDMIKVNSFIELFKKCLEKNMSYRKDGYRKDTDFNRIVENLRTCIIDNKRITITTTVRKACLELNIEPNARVLRRYLRLKLPRLNDKRRFNAFGGLYPINNFSEAVANQLDSLKIGESIKIGKNKYRRMK